MSSLYAKAIASPDPALWNRFVDALAFYRPADPIVAVALAARKGRATPRDAESALRSNSVQCLYGQALHAAVSSVSA